MKWSLSVLYIIVFVFVFAANSYSQKRLQENKIPTAIYYPKPLHLQTAFAFLGYAPGAFPVSEDSANRIFSIPMHPYLLATDQTNIAKILIKGEK